MHIYLSDIYIHLDSSGYVLLSPIHSFEWEKPELQYTADILDYQLHLALEPLEPNEMPDQIESVVNAIYYFQLSFLT